MSARRLVLGDAVLAAVFVVAGQLEVRSHPGDGSVAGPVWLNSLIVLLVCAPLAVRHRVPLSALGASCLALLLPALAWAHSVFFWTDLLPLTLLVWSASTAGASTLHRWCWLWPVVALCADMVHVPAVRDPANVAMALLLYAGTAAAARLTHRYVEQRRLLREALAQLDAEQARGELDAVVAERTRIAGEIHDVVAHALGVLVVQVGAARLGLEQSRRPVPEQLVAAEHSAREALAELRSGVGSLDQLAETARAPLPGLTDVRALVERFRAAGLAVDLQLDVPQELATSLQLTVYRVLQEALTNAAKHADPPQASVTVRREGAAVLVDVHNPTTPSSPRRLPSGGHGLVGMRERVAAFDGRLHATRSASGFRVRAALPVPGSVALAAEATA